MAVNWFASLRDVPWSKVLGMAPTIVDNGRKLWDHVAKKKAEAAAPAGAKTPPPVPESLAAIEIRLAAVEKRAAQLGEEAVSSFDVVRSLAEQHSQLVNAVDVLLVRTRVLVRVIILLAVAIAALFLLVLTR
jgi:hypothetical protein